MIGINNSDKRYGWGSMVLHWSIVILLIVAAYYAYARGFIPRRGPGLDEDVQRELRRAVMNTHFDWSYIVTGLCLVRVVWMLFANKVKEINDDPRLAKLHKAVVSSLVWLPVLLTISGMVNMWSVARPVEILGWTLMQGAPERNQTLHDIMEGVHVGGWYLFAALVVLHAGAAIWHHRVKKDDTLKRMVPWGKVDA